MRSFGELKADAASGFKAAQLFDWGLPVLRGALAVPGSMTVLGGQTGSSKSMMCLKVLDAVDCPALYVSLEDALPVIGHRLKAFRPERLDQVFGVRPIRPRTQYVGRAIRDAFESMIAPKLVIVDYIQTLGSDGTAGTRHEEIGDCIIELKGLGTELGFVTLLVSQLKRPGADMLNEFPSIYNLRDSSNIENAAEAIVLLGKHGENGVEARLCKNKVGPKGAAQFFSRGPGGWLQEVTEEKDAPGLDQGDLPW